MTDIKERLKGILRPGGYDPGDKIIALIKGMDDVERQAEFRIESFCGGGFAGQVYKAKLVRCDDDWLTPGALYAIKFFSTR
ncbi:MAG: hypothetical protein Q7N50_04835, partial [Armatimonadota bacterium]|nr:hypothetical protein [Armatimonadota bacterium]